MQEPILEPIFTKSAAFGYTAVLTLQPRKIQMPITENYKRKE